MGALAARIVLHFLMFLWLQKLILACEIICYYVAAPTMLPQVEKGLFLSKNEKTKCATKETLVTK